MQTLAWRSNILLFLTAMIWGFAFVAQRVGMDFVGPFTFNGLRFALGGISLLPLLWLHRSRPTHNAPKTALWGGALAGLILFMGATLQQIGVIYTTAGKAGFITGLYVILVPLIGLLWKQRPGAATWLGAGLAVVGMYLLSVTRNLTISFGDVLVLIGAFFWAAHVHLIGWLTKKIDPLPLSLFQFATCSALSLIAALLTEPIPASGVEQAWLPILYGGLLSVGVAYTLQVIGQQHARPAHAAIILSLEAVFAVTGGWIILGETLSWRGLLGCALMLAGMLVSQLNKPG